MNRIGYALLFSLPFVASTAWAQVTITIPDVSGAVGQIVEVPVNASGIAALDGDGFDGALQAFGFTITSSSPNVELVGVSGSDAIWSGTLVESWSTKSCNAASNKCSGFDNIDNKLTQDGVLFNIPLRMTANVTGATITLTGEGLNNGFIPVSPATPSFTISTSMAPQANNDSYTVAEGGTLNIAAGAGVLANDTDTDPLTATLGTTTTNGTLTFNADGSFIYVHDGGETLSDSFTYTASDGSETSSSATVTLTVTPVNDTPSADDKTDSTNEDTAVNITLSGSDPDGDALTFSVATGPSNGGVSISGATATYTPATGFSGTDTFTYTANDGTVSSTPATVTVTVIAGNTAPVASDGTATTDEDTAADITLAATDGDGDALTYTVTQPANGTVTLAGNVATYTPNADYNGADTFTFTANDGTVDSNVGTVSVTVTAVNDAPIVADATATTDEDTAVDIALTGTDVEGDALTYSVATAPANGTVTITGATATYTPNADYNGADSFTVTANDGTADSNTATVSVTVTPVNDAPVVSNGSIATIEDTPVNFTLSGTDAEGSTLTFAVTQPANGTVILTGTAVQYTPDQDFNGSDSFTYTANDGTVDSAPGTVSVTVSAVNDAPVANEVAIVTTEGQGVAFNLLGTDPDGDTITYTVISQPANGTLIQSGSSASYLPNEDFFGTDSFQYTVTDGTLTSGAGTVTITVNGVNDAPVAANGAATTDEDTAVQIALSATDADGDNLSYTAGTPSNGTVMVSGATATYTPNADFNGSDSFTFTASDGTESSNEATVTVIVTPVNDAPVADDATLEVAEDTPGSVTLSGSDVDGDALTFAVATQPTNGTVTVSGTTATYTPGADFVGQDTFTYTANDGTVDSPAATVTVTVTSVNDAPVANDLSAEGNEDATIEVTLTGTDSDGDTITFAIADAPSHGTVTLNGAVATYTPESNYNGSDAFTYTASDGQATSGAATVSLTVSPVNDSPTAANLTAETTSDAAIEITLAGEDIDGDALTFEIAADPFSGTATLSGNVVTYQASNGFVGTDAFGFTVSDGTATSAMASVTITVLPPQTFTIQFIHAGGNGLPASLDVYYGSTKVVTSLAAGAATPFASQALGGDILTLAASPSTGPADGFATFTPPWGQGETATAVFTSVGSNQANAQMIEFASSQSAASPSAVDGVLVHASSQSAAVDVTTITTDVDHTPLVSLASGLIFGANSSVFSQAAESHVYRVESGSGQVIGEYQMDLSGTAGEALSLILMDDAANGSVLLRGFRPDGSSVSAGVVTDTQQDASLPGSFVLKGNYPNPFNPTTTISFDLPEMADVQVDVLDLLGRSMISIPAQSMSAGVNRTVSIDAADLTSGIYMYRVMARGASKTWVKSGTMTLIK